MRSFVATFAVVLGLVSGASVGAPGVAKDYPLISRYPGSEIQNYKSTEFDEFLLPLGGIIDGDDHYAKVERIEGRVTKIQYSMPANR